MTIQNHEFHFQVYIDREDEADGWYGDINYDGSLNVVDIVSIVNLIVSNEYELIADTNSDGTLNIIDVVILVNLIIS